MSSVTQSAIACIRAPLSMIETDLLVVPWYEAEAPGRFGELDRATSGEITRALSSKEFAGKPFDILITPIIDRSWKAKRAAIVGAGAESACDIRLARRLATAVTLLSRQRRTESLTFVLRPGLPDPGGYGDPDPGDR